MSENQDQELKQELVKTVTNHFQVIKAGVSLSKGAKCELEVTFEVECLDQTETSRLRNFSEKIRKKETNESNTELKLNVGFEASKGKKESKEEKGDMIKSFIQGFSSYIGGSLNGKAGYDQKKGVQNFTVNDQNRAFVDQVQKTQNKRIQIRGKIIAEGMSEKASDSSVWMKQCSITLPDGTSRTIVDPQGMTLVDNDNKPCGSAQMVNQSETLVFDEDKVGACQPSPLNLQNMQKQFRIDTTGKNICAKAACSQSIAALAYQLSGQQIVFDAAGIFQVLMTLHGQIDAQNVFEPMIPLYFNQMQNRQKPLHLMANDGKWYKIYFELSQEEPDDETLIDCLAGQFLVSYTILHVQRHLAVFLKTSKSEKCYFLLNNWGDSNQLVKLPHVQKNDYHFYKLKLSCFDDDENLVFDQNSLVDSVGVKYKFQHIEEIPQNVRVLENPLKAICSIFSEKFRFNHFTFTSKCDTFLRMRNELNQKQKDSLLSWDVWQTTMRNWRDWSQRHVTSVIDLSENRVIERLLHLTKNPNTQEWELKNVTLFRFTIDQDQFNNQPYKAHGQIERYWRKQTNMTCYLKDDGKKINHFHWVEECKDLVSASQPEESKENNNADDNKSLLQKSALNVSKDYDSSLQKSVDVLKLVKFEVKQQESEKNNHDAKIVIAIGCTGAGKSAFCNTLIDATSNPLQQNYFKTSASCNSMTSVCQQVRGKWLGDPNEKDQQDVIIVDTPGLSDSKGRDGQIMTEIKNFIIEDLVKVDYILLCINGQNPRLDGSLQSILQIFFSTFGGKKNVAKGHLGIVYTRWSNSENARQIRELNQESEEKKETEVREWLAQELKFEPEDCNNLGIFFIDSMDLAIPLNSLSRSNPNLTLEEKFNCIRQQEKTYAALNKLRVEVFKKRTSIRSDEISAVKVHDFDTQFQNVKKEVVEAENFIQETQINHERNYPDWVKPNFRIIFEEYMMPIKTLSEKLYKEFSKEQFEILIKFVHESKLFLQAQIQTHVDRHQQELNQKLKEKSEAEKQILIQNQAKLEEQKIQLEKEKAQKQKQHDTMIAEQKIQSEKEKAQRQQQYNDSIKAIELANKKQQIEQANQIRSIQKEHEESNRKIKKETELFKKKQSIKFRHFPNFNTHDRDGGIGDFYHYDQREQQYFNHDWEWSSQAKKFTSPIVKDHQLTGVQIVNQRTRGKNGPWHLSANEITLNGQRITVTIQHNTWLAIEYTVYFYYTKNSFFDVNV